MNQNETSCLSLIQNFRKTDSWCFIPKKELNRAHFWKQSEFTQAHMFVDSTYHCSLKDIILRKERDCQKDHWLRQWGGLKAKEASTFCAQTVSIISNNISYGSLFLNTLHTTDSNQKSNEHQATKLAFPFFNFPFLLSSSTNVRQRERSD